MYSETDIRYVKDSETESTHLLIPRNLNANQRLYGGQLLEWLDETAGIVAMRHCGGNIVTVSIDNMDFKAGAKLGDMVFIHGYLTSVGRTSMEVRMDSYVEDPEDGKRRLINIAYFVMVAIDEDGKPCPVPRLAATNSFEEAAQEGGRKRQELRKMRRKEGF